MSSQEKKNTSLLSYLTCLRCTQIFPFSCSDQEECYSYVWYSPKHLQSTLSRTSLSIIISCILSLEMSCHYKFCSTKFYSIKYSLHQRILGAQFSQPNKPKSFIFNLCLHLPLFFHYSLLIASLVP